MTAVSIFIYGKFTVGLEGKTALKITTYSYT